MRFIIREQEYETLVASGKYLLVNKEGSLGGTESWRWTRAIDGYAFLRIDLDFRDTRGDSTLIHVTIDPSGTIARLKFRFYSSGVTTKGDLLIEEGQSILNLRTDEYHNKEQLSSKGSSNLVWFPTVTGLGLLARFSENNALMPSTFLDMEDRFTLKNVNVRLSWRSEVEMVVAREKMLVRPCLIQWVNQEATVWFDKFNLPVKMTLDDDIEAIEKHYMRHLLYDRHLHE